MTGRGPCFSSDSAGDGPKLRTRVRDLKRGPEGWAEPAELELPELGDKLLAHAVSDRTALQNYFPR